MIYDAFYFHYYCLSLSITPRSSDNISSLSSVNLHYFHMAFYYYIDGFSHFKITLLRSVSMSYRARAFLISSSRCFSSSLLRFRLRIPSASRFRQVLYDRFISLHYLVLHFLTVTPAFAIPSRLRFSLHHTAYIYFPLLPLSFLALLPFKAAILFDFISFHFHGEIFDADFSFQPHASGSCRYHVTYDASLSIYREYDYLFTIESHMREASSPLTAASRYHIAF